MCHLWWLWARVAILCCFIALCEDYFCAADYLRIPKFSLTNWYILKENTQFVMIVSALPFCVVLLRWLWRLTSKCSAAGRPGYGFIIFLLSNTVTVNSSIFVNFSISVAVNFPIFVKQICTFAYFSISVTVNFFFFVAVIFPSLSSVIFFYLCQWPVS